MAYTPAPSKPEPKYTVLVQVVEVTSGYTTGVGSSAQSYPRTAEDLIKIEVRAENANQAVDRALRQLTVARDVVEGK